MILQCVVYSISEDRIVNYNYGVETDNLPISGLDPDLKVYGTYYTNSIPPYDSRTQTLIITKLTIDNPHPTYPDLLTYQITYSLQRKTDEELYSQVDAMEAYVNSLLFPETDSRLGKQQRYFKILNKKVQGIPTTTDEDNLSSLMDSIADAMDSNADNADLIKDYIDANPTLIPDLDSGWIISLT